MSYKVSCVNDCIKSNQAVLACRHLETIRFVCIIYVCTHASLTSIPLAARDIHAGRPCDLRFYLQRAVAELKAQIRFSGGRLLLDVVRSTARAPA